MKYFNMTIYGIFIILFALSFIPTYYVYLAHLYRHDWNNTLKLYILLVFPMHILITYGLCRILINDLSKLFFDKNYDLLLSSILTLNIILFRDHNSLSLYHFKDYSWQDRQDILKVILKYTCPQENKNIISDFRDFMDNSDNIIDYDIKQKFLEENLYYKLF